MLNEVGIKVRLVISEDNFCLVDDRGNEKLQILHASLFVWKVKLSPTVFVAHARALQNSTAQYPIKRVTCKAFAIRANYLDMTCKKLISGQLLTRVVISLVDNTAFNGSRMLNSFNFHQLHSICTVTSNILRNRFNRTTSVNCMCTPTICCFLALASSTPTRVSAFHAMTTIMDMHFMHSTWHLTWMMTPILTWWDMETYVWHSNSPQCFQLWRSWLLMQSLTM